MIEDREMMSWANLKQASLQVQQQFRGAGLGSRVAAVPTPAGLQGGAAGERTQQEVASLLQPCSHQHVLQLQ